MRSSFMQKLNLVVVPLFMLVALGSLGFIIADKVFGYNYFQERNKKNLVYEIYDGIQSASFFSSNSGTVDIESNVKLPLKDDAGPLTYSSSDENVITVDENGYISAKSFGSAVITASNGNSSSSYIIKVVDFSIIGISFEKDVINMYVGETQEIKYTIEPAEADTSSLEWKSSNENVAVFENGKVIAKGVGSCTISVYSESQKIGDFDVNVSKVNVSQVNNGKLSLNKSKIQIAVGKSVKLVASPSRSGYYWESLDKSVVRVNQDGYVSAVYPGMAAIDVYSPTGERSSCIVIVYNGNQSSINKIEKQYAKSIKIYSQSNTVNVGQTLGLQAEIQLPNAKNKSVIWESDNSNIATVEGGKVTAKSAGIVHIKARTTNGYEDTVELKVKNIEPTSISIYPSQLSLNVGTGKKLSATILPEDSAYNDVIWSSSDRSIATVSADGYVNAIANGEATITANIKNTNIKAVSKVSVTKSNSVIYPTSIKIENKDISLFEGTQESIIYELKPSGITNTNVNFRIENPTIASVNSDGIVRGLKSGSTKIIVTTENNLSAEVNVTVARKTTRCDALVSGSLIVKEGKTSTITVPVGNAVTISYSVWPRSCYNMFLSVVKKDIASAYIIPSANEIKIIGHRIGTTKVYYGFDKNPNNRRSFTVKVVAPSKTYKVTFNKNGLLGADTTDELCTVTSGNSCEVQTPSLSKGNKVILGWSKTQNAKEADYKTSPDGSSVSIPVNSDMTLYAVYYERFNISYDYFNHSFSDGDTYCDMYNADTNCKIINLPQPKNDVDLFLGWSEKSTSVTGSKEIYVNKSTKLYAIFKQPEQKKVLTAKFEPNGVDSLSYYSATCTVEKGQNGCNVTTPIMYWKGHIATQYAKDAEGKNNVSASNAKYYITDNVTLYANTSSNWGGTQRNISVNPSYSYKLNQLLVEQSGACKTYGEGTSSYDIKAYLSQMYQKAPFLFNTPAKLMAMTDSEFHSIYGGNNYYMLVHGFYEYQGIDILCNSRYYDEYSLRNGISYNLGHVMDAAYQFIYNKSGSDYFMSSTAEFKSLYYSVAGIRDSKTGKYKDNPELSSGDFFASMISYYYWNQINGWAKKEVKMRNAIQNIHYDSSNKKYYTWKVNNTYYLWSDIFDPNGKLYKLYNAKFTCFIKEAMRVANGGYKFRGYFYTCL